MTGFGTTSNSEVVNIHSASRDTLLVTASTYSCENLRPRTGLVRAESDQAVSYPQASKKFVHSAGLKMSAQASSARTRPATVRSAILRKYALSLENAFSIGFMSGL